jgi:hypothetical protein
LGGGRSRD